MIRNFRSIKPQWMVGFLFLFFVLSCGLEVGKLVPKEGDKTIVANLSVKDTKLNLKLLVDILFVIDNSGSMMTHQENLSKNTKLFTHLFLKNPSLDFRIAITSTDGIDYTGIAASGQSIPFRGPYHKNTPSINSELAKAFLMGTDGSVTESVFFSSKYILSHSKTYPNFYRQDAFLVLIFITDAEDQSAITPTDLKVFLVNLKQDSSKVLAYAVLAGKNYIGQTCQTLEDEPYKIKAFMALLGNHPVFSLCDPAFGQRLGDIGKNIISKVSAKILLPSKPFLPTIEVSYGSQKIPNSLTKGWVYDPSENALLFSPHMKLKQIGPANKNNEIQVNYDVTDE